MCFQSSATGIVKGRLTPKTHHIKEYPVEMGQYLCCIYADNYLTGEHTGIVNTGEGRK